MIEPPVPHQQVRDYLAASSPSQWRVDIAELRRQTRAEALSVRGELTPVAAVDDLDLGGVSARLYHPRSAGDGGRSVLVWVHGGGWIHGDLDCYEGVARALADRAGCRVLAVDYRLAPEHRFPAGLDDVWAATRWAAEHFDAVAVAGDSSGGNLAAVTALRARDAGLPLALQLLVYPMLESRADTPVKLAFAQRYHDFAGQPDFGPTTVERIDQLWQTYAPDPTQRASALVSPPHAATLAGLAPAVLITAEHDLLRGEAEDYAQRLAADGVAVRTHTYPGQIHGFFQMLGVMSDAHDAVDRAAADLRAAFAPTSPTRPI